MRAQRLRIVLIFIALACISPLSKAAHSQAAHSVTPQELSAAIAELRSGKHEVEADASKDDAGAHLAHLIRRTNPDQVNDRTVAGIAVTCPAILPGQGSNLPKSQTFQA